MNHLQIIKEAYDKCGIVFVPKSNKEGWTYLFLTNEQEKGRTEATDLDFLCRYETYMEFNKQGEIASY